MVDDRVVFPVTITKTIGFTFTVLAKDEDEAAAIIDNMYMNGELDDYFAEGDSLADVGHTIDVDDIDLHRIPEIDEDGFIGGNPLWQ